MITVAQAIAQLKTYPASDLAFVNFQGSYIPVNRAYGAPGQGDVSIGHFPPFTPQLNVGQVLADLEAYPGTDTIDMGPAYPFSSISQSGSSVYFNI